MQSTNELVEEAKKKRTLSSLKPTSLPESQNTIKPEKNNAVDTVKPETQNDLKPENKNNGNKVLPENQNTIKKVKVTVYITEDSWKDFNNIYGTRILNQRKTDKGELMMEAIESLKEKEFTRIP